MSIVDNMSKQLAVLLHENIRWQHPHLQRAAVPVRVPSATRAYKESTAEENNKKVFQGLEKFEKFYKG
ncbi:MAG: hypothetical protein HUJ29_09180 [Gammaproteobacteria bacterium]|nr:hypothetical protein [Gammaproteobacteria bacterium]